MAETIRQNTRANQRFEDCIFIGGATAVGKSAVALELAERIGGEIVSVDSMQVYRGLDIGSAKPSREEQQRVRHHLIDVVDLTDSFNAAQFLKEADKALGDIRVRGHVPIFCGGTGLYFKAFIKGLGSTPDRNPKLRAEVEATPIPELLAELRKFDPVAFESIDRNNPRRVFRAVEVIRSTGKPFSAQRSDWGGATPVQSEAPHFFGLTRSPGDSVERIRTRVDQMFRDGLVAETECLLQKGLAQNRTAMQALGYHQVVEHLRGERSLEETIDLVKIRTRQFAKRQLTWFRGQFRPEWILLEPQTSPSEACEKILSAWRK